MDSDFRVIKESNCLREISGIGCADPVFLICKVRTILAHARLTATLKFLSVTRLYSIGSESGTLTGDRKIGNQVLMM